MDEQYRPRTFEQKMGYLVEEAGEVLAAAGKTQRWGLRSVNPELPPEEQETNRDWLLRELKDLRRAIDFVETELIDDQARESRDAIELATRGMER